MAILSRTVQPKAHIYSVAVMMYFRDDINAEELAEKLASEPKSDGRQCHPRPRWGIWGETGQALAAALTYIMDGCLHTTQCCTMQNYELPCNTIDYYAIPCNTMQYHTMPYIDIHHKWVAASRLLAFAFGHGLDLNEHHMHHMLIIIITI